MDLLIVMPVKGPKHKKKIEIRVAVHHIQVAKDIIVTTPEDFAWRKEIAGTIEYPAVQEGKLLYARSRSNRRSGFGTGRSSTRASQRTPL